MLKAGDFVKAKRGHDKNSIFIIVNVVNEKFVLISNGKSKTIDNPKLKNIRHLKLVQVSTDFENKITTGTISDKEIVSKIETLINN